MDFPQTYTHSASADEAEDRIRAASGIPGVIIKKGESEPNGLVVLETTFTNPTSLRMFNMRLRGNGSHPMAEREP
jgi:hypothetical protein